MEEEASGYVTYQYTVPDWYKWIIFLLPTGKGTFYDELYIWDFAPNWDIESHFSTYQVLIHLPKHLADDNVTITPLIVDYPSVRPTPHPVIIHDIIDRGFPLYKERVKD